MPNIKSKKKRVRTNEICRQRNVDVRSKMKTQLKKTEAALESKDAAQIEVAVRDAISEIDVAARKGVLHQKTAARKKSRLQKRANAQKS